MIIFLNILSFFLEWGYVFILFWILHTFLPLHNYRFIKVLAFFICSIFATSPIYSNDLPNLLGALVIIAAYILIFHQGQWTEKMTAVLVFYPIFIAINYLMYDISSRLFFRFNKVGDPPVGWTSQTYLISTAFHTIALLLRLLFWIGTWLFLRKYLHQITSNLTTRMWLIVDAIMLTSFVSIFSVIYFVTDDPVIVYPICAASIFSSFGCIYLVSYICNSIHTAYHAQELERWKAYYKDRMKNEERVRSIYHDMKNHLLVLQAQSSDSQEISQSIHTLQEQIVDYENYYHTGNDFLDVIIRDKSRLAKEKHIDFHAVIQFEDGGFMELLDISTIFGNALDNAIEASEKLPEDMRLITVKTSRIHDMLLITVENNMVPAALFDGKTTKKEPFLHGFGFSNLQKTAEKYGGQCIAKPQDNIFMLKVILPVPVS